MFSPEVFLIKCPTAIYFLQDKFEGLQLPKLRVGGRSFCRADRKAGVSAEGQRGMLTSPFLVVGGVIIIITINEDDEDY